MKLFLGAGLAPGLAVGTAEAAQAQPQTAAIRIEVVAGVMPVDGAQVTAGGATAETDALGVATLTLPVGSLSVMATKDGYDTAIARVDVVAGGGRTVRLVLNPTVPDEGTIVASPRTLQPAGDQAVPIGLLGRDQIEARMLQAPGDIAMLFNEMAGLRAQITSPVLGTTMLRVRGLPGHYTRLLSDGVPLYSDRPGGHALLRIPPMDLGQVEVIKEPASALFGSDAIGVVNLLARRPGHEPDREFLFNQSAEGATDGVLWISSPPKGSWSSTYLFGGHRQDERDVDDDGWSDFAGYERGVARTRVYWNNGRGRSVSGVAGVTFETREGGSEFARESLETKTADGGLSGQMILDSGYILAGASELFVQSRTHDFSDRREADRLQAATIELTLRRPGTRHTWLAGIAADWYAIRTPSEPLPSSYVSTRPGIFVHDDLTVAPWLLVSGSLRLDYHNLYGFLMSPRGSALMRSGPWEARFSAAQGYFTPRPLTEETEAAGLAHLTIVEPLEVETARSVSADLTHRTGVTAVTVTVFRSQVNDPAQIDRATYTLRTETEPIVSQGVEVLATLRRAPFSMTGTYAYVDTRERGDLDLALTPRHRGGFIAAASGDRGRIGLEVSFTGAQRLDRNPYRLTSESYVLLGLLGEYRFGPWGVFVNADNLTNVRQTDWDPIGRPAPDVDGRWTVDAWAPLEGRVISVGIRVSF